MEYGWKPGLQSIRDLPEGRDNVFSFRMCQHLTIAHVGVCLLSDQVSGLRLEMGQDHAVFGETYPSLVGI